MNRDIYESLLKEPKSVLKEHRTTYQKLRERHLHVLWYEQQYLSNLKTSTGESIEVKSPGIWNCGSGPDFMKAHLKIGEKEFRGDIEIDFSDDLWNHHGHHRDSRYNQVVLHLSFSPQTKEIFNSLGSPVRRAYLEKSLMISTQEIMQKVDLDLYPYKEFVGSGKCASTLYSELETEEIEQLFESAARWRLKKKLSYLERMSKSTQDIIPSGIALGLGYGHNGEAFLELFQELRRHRDKTQDEVLAIGLGMCGFFEKKFHIRWKDSRKYQMLMDLWKGHESEIEHQAVVRLDRVRPHNHPIRRLVYLSHLLTHKKLETIQNDLSLTILHSKKPLDHLFSIIPDYEDPYWNRHFTFELEEQKGFLNLTGADLKMRIVANTFLPYLYRLVEKPEEEVLFWRFYRTLAGTKSGKRDYLRHRFFGDRQEGKTLKRTYAEQGAFQIHHDFCVHYEASCEGCPFVEKFKETARN